MLLAIIRNNIQPGQSPVPAAFKKSRVNPEIQGS